MCDAIGKSKTLEAKKGFVVAFLLPLYNISFCYCAVDGGHRAVIFDRFRGVQEEVSGEGTHFLIPWVQKPIIFDCRARPRNVPVITGSKGKIFFPVVLF